MTHKKVIEKELDGFGIRLNQKPPDIIFRKKDKGGLNYQEVVPQVCSLSPAQCRCLIMSYSNDFEVVATPDNNDNNDEDCW